MIRVAIGALLCATVVRAQDRTMPPEAERQLARSIYKEMVEIKSGYTTGATTPVAEAVAKRLKAAGFPAADIFVGGASPTKANLVVRYRGTGTTQADSPPRAHRRRRGEARRLEHGSVRPHREGRLLLRPRRGRRQGASRGLDREPHSIQARRVQARPRHHRRADGRRRGRRPVQRRRVADQEQARLDRRGALPQRRWLGRICRRDARGQRPSGQREVRHQLQARGAQQGRPQFPARGRQRHLPSWPAPSTISPSSGFP